MVGNIISIYASARLVSVTIPQFKKNVYVFKSPLQSKTSRDRYVSSLKLPDYCFKPKL